MAEPDQKRVRRFLTALIAGALLGAGVGLYIRSQRLPKPSPGPTPAQAETTPPAADAPSVSAIEDSAAWRYARAYQEGNWEQVLAYTLWAQERLERVRVSGGPDTETTERDVLLESFGTRNILENQLQDSGVEDQYVFTPGAALAFDSVDEGRDDLEKPVARRTWVVVTYPAREKALLDRDNIPIRSVRVGINVSEDGYILKAGIVGNLDIDWESIKYDWPAD